MDRNRLLVGWGILLVVALSATGAVMSRGRQARADQAAQVGAQSPADEAMLDRQIANAYVMDFYDRLEHNARWQLPAAEITVDRCALESQFDRDVVLNTAERQFFRAVEAMCQAKFDDNTAAYASARAQAFPFVTDPGRLDQ